MVFTARVWIILIGDSVFLGLSHVYHLAKLLLDFLLLLSLLSTEFLDQAELKRVEESVLLPNRALMTPGTKPFNSTEQERKTDSKGGGLPITFEQVRSSTPQFPHLWGAGGHYADSQMTITIHLETPSQTARRNITLNMLIKCETHTDFQMLESPFKTWPLGWKKHGFELGAVGIQRTWG